MSIIRLDQDNIERYSLLANPRVYFSSSSNGTTGSLPLFADGSSTLKDVHHSLGLYSEATSASSDSDVESLRSAALSSAYGGNSSIYGEVNSYISFMNALPSSTKFAKRQSVIRFEPGVSLDPNFMRKKIVRENLFPHYIADAPTSQWNYTNYHTLNFVTGGNLIKNSAMIYPASTSTFALGGQNALAPSSSFTFDFYINPRYTQEKVGDDFKAGTILHMSSCYALSLVTGSQTGIDGKKNGFRLLLQLSQSAEIQPSKCLISSNTVTAPGQTADPGFLFVSDDNALQLNNWHHIAIRWGGTSVNLGTGSFVIDGAERGNFVITSASCMKAISPAGVSNPDALFVGNFFEGSNKNTNSIAGYFNNQAVINEGVTPIGGINDAYYQDPADAQLRHPLNAEIHDIKIFQTYRTTQQILTSSVSGYPLVTGSVSLTGSQDLIFYVPPLFVKEVPSRSILTTPFEAELGTSTTPFNTALSFGTAGHEINLENFSREFVRGTHPRLLHLTSTAQTVFTAAAPANDILYENASTIKRNITVLPCDNGKFRPNFLMLLSGGLTYAESGNKLEMFVNDLGATDLSIIKLVDLVSTATLFKNINDDFVTSRNSLLGDLITPVSLSGTVEPGGGSNLTILQRTWDNSSNEVVFFDISNMFYGDRIKPKSVVLTDLSVTGSEDRIKITLKDNGYGNLYRADAETANATWASVGNVLYEEGIIAIKSPNIPMFGKNEWEISFEGERYVEVYEVNVPAPKSMVNSSSNPQFQPMIPSDYASETAESFVYITGIQLHDENLNVIGRSNMAQPIIKRDGDRILFRLRMDY